MTLKEKLLKFNGSNDEDELLKMFDELAPSFLYGGFIKVRDDYQVFIRTVEFYFHSEKTYGIHDPIVYHRNIRNREGRILHEQPYFPTMTLHAHNSGFDITFENKDEKYRASALIRTYEVKDKQGNYLIWRKDEESGNYMFQSSDIYGFNTQSTYLYTLLNGFSLETANDIQWIEEPRKQTLAIEPRPRKNVFKSESEWKYIPVKINRCERMWSFTRKDEI